MNLTDLSRTIFQPFGACPVPTVPPLPDRSFVEPSAGTALAISSTALAGVDPAAGTVLSTASTIAGVDPAAGTALATTSAIAGVDPAAGSILFIR